MSYETRKLSEMDFPVYFSLVPDPGYNIPYFDSHGIEGEWYLFLGDIVNTKDNKTGITWGGVNHSIKGLSLTLW